MTPDTGMSSDMGADFDNATVAAAVAATVDEVYARTDQDAILVTHSQGSGPGWTVAASPTISPPSSPSSRAGRPERTPTTTGPSPTAGYRWSCTSAITSTTATLPSRRRGAWQGMRQTCYDFEAAYTAEGGNCTVVDLPKEGITGNDHFMFQDLNNDVVAAHVEGWIRANVVQGA